MSCLPRSAFFLFLSLLLAACQREGNQRTAQKKEITLTMKLTSSAFQNGSSIPHKYTCDGEDVSPQMQWGDVPTGAQSFVLICDDPDAPGGTWTHWVIYNIPAQVRELGEAVPKSDTLSNGALQGLNDFKRVGYGGPCPPSGSHRYFFRLSVLDLSLKLQPRAARAEVEQAMAGHVVASGELMGTYRRK
jgi:Raf kinase inhibitor-like YbhB/YbcL family protein